MLFRGNHKLSFLRECANRAFPHAETDELPQKLLFSLPQISIRLLLYLKKKSDTAVQDTYCTIRCRVACDRQTRLQINPTVRLASEVSTAALKVLMRSAQKSLRFVKDFPRKPNVLPLGEITMCCHVARKQGPKRRAPKKLTPG